MRRNSIAANPILIGAATALVAMVAVFLSYNANTGLPFVPTYNLTVQLPSAANLVVGNEVRLGANRIGIVSSVKAKRMPDGTTIAELGVKIEDRLRPLPKDTTTLVRSKSALGLKYLELTRGTSSDGLEQDATIPLSQSSEPVEFDETFAWADERTRKAQQRQLVGIGDAVAGRGQDLNTTIAGLAPLLDQLRPVAENLSNPDTKLSGLIQGLSRFTGEVAPVAEDQAQLFVNLDATFSAFASVARPYLQDAITEWPVLEQTLIDELPQQRPFLRHSTQLFAALRPGTRAIANESTAVGNALELSGPALKQTITLNERLRPTLKELQATASEPLVQLGVRDLRLTGGILNPLLAFLTPAQTVCNYGSLALRNLSNSNSIGDSVGTAQKFQLVFPPTGPNNEGGPASSFANGGGTPGVLSGKDVNFLRQNPYPNTAAPGQERECEAGNERPFPIGKALIGNVPGNQGINTETTTSKIPGWSGASK